MKIKDFVAHLFPSSPESGLEPTKPKPKLHTDEKLILLLGTGGSGKTALLMQMCTDKDDLEKRKHILHETILEYFDLFTMERNECVGMGEFLEEFKKIGPKILTSTRYWNQEMAGNLFKLFYDTGFQHMVYQKKSKLYSHDNISYFMKRNNFERIRHLSAKLNYEDLMRIMIKTSGYSSFSPIKGVTIGDTGGQRTERKKWRTIIKEQGGNVIQCLVVSLAEFDEVCYEDDVTNRYVESLNCFKEEFTNTKDLAVIFSKYEVLERKVCEGVRFSKFVPEFTGDDSQPEQVKDFIIDQYLKLDIEKKIKKYFVLYSAFKHHDLEILFNELTETNLFDGYFEYLRKRDEKEEIPFENDNVLEKWTARALEEDEILQISEFLELQDLLNLNIVCKEWNQITFRASLALRRPNFDYFLKTSYEHVQHLNLQARFIQRRHFESLVTQLRFSQLEYLDLSNNYLLDQVDYDYLFNSHEFRYLKTLILDYSNLQNLSFIYNTPHLQLNSLSLNGIKGIDTDQVLELLKSPCCCNMKELNTKHCNNIDTETIKHAIRKQFGNSFSHNYQQVNEFI